MRKHQPQGKDRRYFRRTASRSKKINIDPVIYRGGLRL